MILACFQYLLKLTVVISKTTMKMDVCNVNNVFDGLLILNVRIDPQTSFVWRVLNPGRLGIVLIERRWILFVNNSKGLEKAI
jgi:hypothetical protein